MALPAALGLALALWGLRAAASPGPSALLPQGTYTLTNGHSTTVLARNVWLGGSVLQDVPALPSAEACAAACRDVATCDVFNYGAVEGGTNDGIAPLPYQTCRMLSINCTLAPEITGHLGGTQKTTSGFPVRAPPLHPPGFEVRPGQAVQGADFSCDGSLVPGACAMPTALSAVLVCSRNPQCLTVVIYPNGTNGCSGELGVLKNIRSASSNTLMAPRAIVLDKAEAATLETRYLLAPESNVTLPPPAELDAAIAEVAADPQNSTAWLGCITAHHVLMDGSVVDVLEGVEDAEACCRACRELGPDTCNAWNYCGRPEGCSYQDLEHNIRLEAEQCELRWQYLAAVGWPPAVIAKGTASANFTAGSPNSAAGPLLPGYSRSFGTGLFGQPGYTCKGSLQLEIDECALSMSLPGLGDYCSADPQCAAFVSYRPDGLLPTQEAIGIFHHADGANASLMVRTPSTVLYIKEELQTATSSSDAAGDSGLSAGAIAGIAVGAVVAALAAAAVGWVLRKRQHRQGSRARAVAPGGSEVKVVLEMGDSEQYGGSAPCPVSSAAPTSSALSAQALAVLSEAVALETPRLHINTASSPAQSALFTGVRFATIWSGRPIAVSPFASRRAAMSATCSGSAELGSSGPPGESRPASSSSAASWRPPELGDVLFELVEQRAAEDAGGSLGRGCTALASASGGPAGPRTPASASFGTPSHLLQRGGLPGALQEWVIPPGDINILNKPGTQSEPWVLGQGASGIVYKATYHGETVAMKEINIGRSLDAQQTFVREAMRLQLLRHPNVVGQVSFYAMALDGGKGKLVIEFCEGRDLHSVLRLQAADGQRLFGWYRLGCKVATDVAKALSYLHYMGVVHMDIKGSNVLLSDRGKAKLSDVGLSRLQTHTFLSELPMVGTWAWVAPEVLMGGRNCTSAVDLYSFGILLWEIITGEQPQRGRLRQPRVPDECPQEAVDLLQQCCSLEPSARPTAQQVLERLMCMAEGRAPAGTLRRITAHF